MVSTVVVLFLFALILYAYTNHKREFTATASAIRQIWSGSCRLSCRQSENSGFSGLSGLSGLPKRLDHGAETDSIQANQGQNAGPSNDCPCESCPCALIENVLRACRPATNLYAGLIELLSSAYCNAVKNLSDMYKYVERVADCGVSCQRPAQLISVKQLDSADNINFKNRTAAKAEGKKVEIETTPKKEITFRRKSNAEVLKEPNSAIKNQKADLNLKQSEDIKCSSESEGSPSIQAKENCSKCVQKGKTCMGNCPRANRERNKKDKK